MPDIPVRIVAPGIVRVTYDMTVGGGRHANVVQDYHLDVASGGRDDAVHDLIQHVAVPFQDNWMANVASNVTFLGGRYIDLDNLDGEVGSFAAVAGHPLTGAITGTPLMTPQVSYLIKKLAGAHRGQRNGRSYMPGLAETEVDEAGVVQASRVTTWNTKLDTFRDDIAGISDDIGNSVAWRVTHVSKADPEDPSTWTWSSSTVTDAICDTKCATQRRRLRG